MADIIQIKRGTAAQWASINPVLADGELGYEKDTKKGKIGDGVTAWNSLPYSWTGEVQDSIEAQIAAAASKAMPVDADEFGITDSGAAGVLKRLSWANIKATLKTYFDTLYEAAFSKGNIVQGTNVTITGTLTGRLVGTGDLTINAEASGDVAGEILGATEKTSPSNNDLFGIVDGATSILRKLTLSNLKISIGTGDFVFQNKVTSNESVSTVFSSGAVNVSLANGAKQTFLISVGVGLYISVISVSAGIVIAGVYLVQRSNDTIFLTSIKADPNLTFDKPATVGEFFVQNNSGSTCSFQMSVININKIR